MSGESSNISHSHGSEVVDDDGSHSSEIPSPRSKLAKRKRACKDPNAPTRPLSAYVLFLVEKQQEFRKADSEPQVVADITRRVGAAWKALSAEDRKVYEEEAEKRKARYLQELAEYEKTDLHRQFLEQKKRLSDGTMESDTQEPVKKRQRKARNATPATSDGTPSSEAPSSEKGDERRKPGRPWKNSSLVSRQNVPGTGSQPRPQCEWVEPSENPYATAGTKASDASIGGLTELRVPIFNKEFMDWNTQREKELRQVRHQVHELEIDMAGLQTQKEHEAKMQAEIANSKMKLLGVNAARKEVVKILISEFSGVRLANGLSLTETNVEEYMSEMEKATGRSPARHTDLMGKIREVAQKLQPFMAHLQ